MNRLLHIIASPRGSLSRTLTLSASFLEEIRKKHPRLIIDELDLHTEALPDMFSETVSGKYVLLEGKSIPAELKPRWKEIEAHINRFMAANIILLSTPMWNFGMPYRLKHYFDVIVQPRHLFYYGENGVVGLARGKRVFVISTRGGDYSESSPIRSYDHLEPHLRVIFDFIGVSDPVFFNSEPMDTGGEELCRELLNKGLDQVKKLVPDKL